MMHFSGSLETISFASLIRLLLHERYSGVLTLQFGDNSKYVYIDNGNLFSVTSNSNRKSLSDILIERQQLTKDQLEEALQAHQEGVKIGQILVRKGFITRNQLYLALQAQMEEMLYELLEWHDGEFSFERSEFNKESLIPMHEMGTKFLSEAFDDTTRLFNILSFLPDLDCFPTVSPDIDPLNYKERLPLEELFLLCLINARWSVRKYFNAFQRELLHYGELFVSLNQKHLIEFRRIKTQTSSNQDIIEQNRVLTALVIEMKLFLESETARQSQLIRNLELLMPQIGKTFTLAIPTALAPETVVPFSEDLGDEALDSLLQSQDEPEATPEPAFEPVETPEQKQEAPSIAEPVAVSSDEFFPWFQTVQPGSETEESAPPEVASEPVLAASSDMDDDNLAGILLDEALEDLPVEAEDVAVVAPTQGQSVPAKQPESVTYKQQVTAPPSPPQKPAVKPQSAEDGELFEEFMEDKVAKRVQYQRFKSSIKMAYNRINMRKLNYFEILEVTPSAPMKDIERSYNRLKKQYNPVGVLKERDKEHWDQANKVLEKLREAYEVLIDTDKRREYSKKVKQAREDVDKKKETALMTFHEGMLLYKEGKFDEAREAFRKALSYDSNNPVYYNMLSTVEENEKQRESMKFFQAGKLIFEKKNDVERAVKLIRKAISIDPRSQYLIKLGDIFAQNKETIPDAIATYEEALKKDPGNADMHVTLGKLKMKRPNLSEKEAALAHFIDALKWDENHIEAKQFKAQLEAEGVKIKAQKDAQKKEK